MAVRKRKSPVEPSEQTPRDAAGGSIAPRIIAGRFRGRKLLYSGDPRTRPMKDRVREAVFNLLGPAIREKHAVDLFAGTGALGLEALSRGAARATFIEQHYPTAEILQRNVRSLGVESLCQLVTADTLIWFERQPDLGSTPWVVFCSPPYDFYVDRRDEMLGLIRGLAQAAPPESLLVVEADSRFDFQLPPEAHGWDIRCYPPAVVGIYHKPALPS